MDDTLSAFIHDHFATAVEAAEASSSMTSLSVCQLNPDGERSYQSRSQPSYPRVVDWPQDINLIDQYLQFPQSSHNELNRFFSDSTINTRSLLQQEEDQLGFGQSGTKYGKVSGSVLYGDGHTDLYIDNSATRIYEIFPEEENLLSLTMKDIGWDTSTIIQHGQITPGDSAEPPSTFIDNGKPKQPKLQRTPRKMASSLSKKTDAAPNKKNTKARKSGKSHKKSQTLEEQLAKHERFLERNRIAAYKCRIKRRSQTHHLQQRATEQANEIAAKRLEIERLQLEIETLRAFSVPHYRDCGDQNLVEYIDATTSSYEAWVNETLPEVLQALQRAGGFASDETMIDYIEGDSNGITSAQLDGLGAGLSHFVIPTKHDSPAQFDDLRVSHSVGDLRNDLSYAAEQVRSPRSANCLGNSSRSSPYTRYDHNHGDSNWPTLSPKADEQPMPDSTQLIPVLKHKIEHDNRMTNAVMEFQNLMTFLDLQNKERLQVVLMVDS